MGYIRKKYVRGCIWSLCSGLFISGGLTVTHPGTYSYRSVYNCHREATLGPYPTRRATGRCSPARPVLGYRLSPPMKLNVHSDSESEWTFNFIGGLKRYPKTGRLIIDKSLAVHEALNGSLGKDYMVANWSKLEGLTPQALGLYVAYCLRSDPHYWKLENIAAAVSTNKKSSRAEAEAEKALQELESVGIHVREPDSPKGTRVKVLAAPDYNGPWPFWWDKGPR